MSRDPSLRLEDILAHAYFRAEDSIIWDAATNHLLPLVEFAKQQLND